MNVFADQYGAVDIQGKVRVVGRQKVNNLYRQKL